MKTANFSDLVGKTLSSIMNMDDELIFTTINGIKYRLYHIQDCCESVTIDDIDGNLNDIIGSPILVAEETTNSNDNFGRGLYESFTWTFYRLATIKGYVTIRWLGESNGYYSESVDFEQVN